MLDEIKEYFETSEDSDQYYRDIGQVRTDNPVPRWNDAWNAEQRAEFYEASEKHDVAVLKAKYAYQEHRAVIRDKLRNHENPVIKWLMTDTVINRDYAGYRDEILKALPLTREEIEEFGDRKGWCGDYSRMVERANRAGVLPEPVPEIADIEPLINDFVSWYGGSSRMFRNKILKHLPAIIASYEAKQAEAKAEAEKAAAATTTTTKTADTARSGRRSAAVTNTA